MSNRSLGLVVVCALGTAAAFTSNAEATAFASTGWLVNSVSGSATTSGGARTYALTLPVPAPVPGFCSSTGAAPPGTASATSLADSLFGAFARATATGRGAAGPEEPFLTPIVSAMGFAESELTTSGYWSGSMVTINGTATFGTGGAMEMAVLDLTGLDPYFMANMQATQYSVERAVNSGYLEPWRVLGRWRESDVTSGSLFSFTVDIGSVQIENVGFAALTHAVSDVPAPGAMALTGCGLLLIARRRRQA